MISNVTLVFENGQEVEASLLSARFEVETPADTDYGTLDRLSTIKLPASEYYARRQDNARGNLVRIRLVGEAGEGRTKPESEPR